MRTDITVLYWMLIVSGAGAAEPTTGATAPDRQTYPRLITAQTRADLQALAALEKPGKVFFRDDFESPESLEKYFEIRGLDRRQAVHSLRRLPVADQCRREAEAVQHRCVRSSCDKGQHGLVR